MSTTLRAARVLGWIATFLVARSLAEVFHSMAGTTDGALNAIRARAASRYARRVLRALGLVVTRSGRAPAREERQLIVANHVSFWDVLILAAETPSRFITSVEVRDTPILGWLARLCGSVFVERRARDLKGEARSSLIRADVEQVAVALSQDLPVAMFPEGTSSNGEQLLPFRRALFSSALLTRARVQPVSIRYLRLAGEPLSSANRDRLFYYGDLNFTVQLLRSCTIGSIEAEITFLRPINAHPYVDPQELASASRETIQERLCQSVVGDSPAAMPV